MGDSDEEHDRSKNRDKFRRERNDYGDKPRSRTDYRDRRTWRDEHDNTVNLCVNFYMYNYIYYLLMGTHCAVLALCVIVCECTWGYMQVQ